MKLNNFLAAPAMKAWTEGEPIDLDRMLYGPRASRGWRSSPSPTWGTPSGCSSSPCCCCRWSAGCARSPGPPACGPCCTWTRSSATCPPVANPPSKAPLLTLLKQARAFGVGIVLATQNPVDLDYKALSNAGTWFIGRLQTARDQQRVLDGLAGASGATRFDRQKMGQLLAGLGNRVFLMNNVHEDQPVLFESRWAMSYLRGPLTRDQIRKLLEPLRPALAAAGAARWGRAPAAPAAAATAAARTAAGATAAAAPGAAQDRPAITPAIAQFFLPQRRDPPGAATLVYEPRCLGIAKVYYADAKAGLAAEREVAVLADIDAQLSRPAVGGSRPGGGAGPGPGNRPGARGPVRRGPRRAGGSEELRGLGRGLPRMAVPQPGLARVPQPLAGGLLPAGRVGKGLPPAPAAERPGTPRPAPGAHPPALRRPDRRRWRSASGAPSRRWTARRSRPNSRRCRPPFPSG